MTPNSRSFGVLAPIAWLIGTWEGDGVGVYPTIDDFAYHEVITFDDVGKPFLVYDQKAKLADGTPSHRETGYWRMTPSGLEVVIAQPTGIVEIHAGTVGEARIGLVSTDVRRTPTAKEVTVREWDLELVPDPDGGPDTLRYELRMAAVGQPTQVHLRAALHRR
jgi:hypothetical protein